MINIKKDQILENDNYCGVPSAHLLSNGAYPPHTASVGLMGWCAVGTVFVGNVL